MRRLQADADMSSSYSANQYDSAFRSQRLQNWCETKRFKERPNAQEGHTTFIANDRGHLLPGVAKTSGDIHQDCAAPSTAVARPASQNSPVTGGEGTASQNQDLQAAVVGSVTQSAEDKQATQATGKDRPSGQCSAAEEKPALSQAAAGGNSSSPETDKGRPVSSVSEKAAASSSMQRHRNAQEDQ
ncbi:protein Flattop isoform X2 [Seriola dumerili]|uniref:protein Flattop isoform X2 n=1 Tax=Seriola dumerili TaxID=41447 RepID=UPI000BBE1045|nr:protein Flattop isoform X2 [Seriola dumerili]